MESFFVFQQEHRELAREAVRKSLVLLKNGKSADDPMLPLPKKAKKILVAGTHADNLGYQCGGWTITWQGLSGNNLTAGKYLLLIEHLDPLTSTWNDNSVLFLFTMICNQEPRSSKPLNPLLMTPPRLCTPKTLTMTLLRAISLIMRL